MGVMKASFCAVCVSKNADLASRSTLGVLPDELNNGNCEVDCMSATTFVSVFLTGDELVDNSSGTLLLRPDSE